MTSCLTAASVQTIWRNIQAQAMEIWASPDFHFLELSYPRFQDLLPEFDNSVAEFSQTAYACAADKNLAAVQELHRGFAGWLALCDIPKSFCGKVQRANYDLFKFVGHEMLITLIAALLHHEFWDALNAILSEDWGRRYQSRIRYSSSFFQYFTLFDCDKAGPNGLVSDLLIGRHGNGGRFSAICPLEDFQAADLFLCCHHRSQRNEQTSPQDGWVPWSLNRAQELPNFLSGHSGPFVDQLVSLFGLSSLEELRQFTEIQLRLSLRRP